jgi:hypothetical protein
MITAFKPVPIKETNGYRVKVVLDVTNLGAYAANGYACFDNAKTFLASVKNGYSLSHWTQKKKQWAIEWLESQI